MMFVCKHCKRKLETEKLMISHLRSFHGMNLPKGLENLYDGGFEKKKKEILDKLNKKEQFYN